MSEGERRGDCQRKMPVPGQSVGQSGWAVSRGNGAYRAPASIVPWSQSSSMSCSRAVRMKIIRRHSEFRWICSAFCGQVRNFL